MLFDFISFQKSTAVTLGAGLEAWHLFNENLQGMILPYSLVVGQLPRTYAEAVSGSQSKPSSAECLIVIEANVLSADEDFDIAVKVKAHVLYIQVLVSTF